MQSPTLSPSRRPAMRAHPGHLALALGVIGIGTLLAWGASRFPVEKGYSILGPQVFPYAVAVFLLGVGTVLAYQAFTGGLRQLEAGAQASMTAQQGAAWVSIGLVVMAMLITYIGFVLSATLLFALAARGFGSRRPTLDLGIGLGLALPVYWVFTRGLGVSLPALFNAWI